MKRYLYIYFSTYSNFKNCYLVLGKRLISFFNYNLTSSKEFSIICGNLVLCFLTCGLSKNLSAFIRV